MKRALPLGLTFALASIAATTALILFAKAVGWLRMSQGLFATPIPYFLLFVCFFGVSPAYLMLHSVVRLHLGRFLALSAAMGLGLYWLRGSMWNWHTAFLGRWENLVGFVGLPVAGALAYWATLKWLAPELGER